MSRNLGRREERFSGKESLIDHLGNPLNCPFLIYLFYPGGRRRASRASRDLELIFGPGLWAINQCPARCLGTALNGDATRLKEFCYEYFTHPNY